jgi:hypothetical protein
MSAFTFDFDLEDDLDESFDAIPPQESTAVPSIDKTLVSSFGRRAWRSDTSGGNHAFFVGPFIHFWSPLWNLISFGTAALRSSRSILIFAHNAPYTYYYNWRRRPYTRAS